jgi:hypothetical protein
MGAKVDPAKLRARWIGARLTDDEYRRVQAAAGMTQPSEFVRALVLKSLDHPLERTVLAEVLAMRTVLINVLRQVAPAVDIKALDEWADKDKREKARAALNGETR